MCLSYRNDKPLIFIISSPFQWSNAEKPNELCFQSCIITIYGKVILLIVQTHNDKITLWGGMYIVHTMNLYLSLVCGYVTVYVYLSRRGQCRPNLDLCQIGVSQCDAGRSSRGLLKKDMGKGTHQTFKVFRENTGNSLSAHRCLALISHGVYTLSSALSLSLTPCKTHRSFLWCLNWLEIDTLHSSHGLPSKFKIY